MPLKYPLSSFRRRHLSTLTAPTSRIRSGRLAVSSNHILILFAVAAAIVYFFLMCLSESERQSLRPALDRSNNRMSVRSGVGRESSVDNARSGRVAKMAKNVDLLVEPPSSNGANVGLARVQVAKLAESKLLEMDSFPPPDFRARMSYFRNRCGEEFPDADIATCGLDNEMEHRREHVKKSCSSSKSFLGGRARPRRFQPLESSRLFVMPYRQLIWCPVYKAASTNWMLNIPLLSNFRPSELQALKQALNQPNEVARHIARPLERDAFLNFLNGHRSKPVSFLIVRHPLDRLLSAYRDKFERRNAHFHSLYGWKMVRDFRKAGLTRFGVEFYLEHKDQSTPTFWEFVKAILEQNVIDDHWRPAYSSCSLCNAHNFTYDYILRYENLAEEEAYLINSLKLNRALKSRHEHASRDPIDFEEKRSYFQVFNEKEMAALYEFYRNDFELFQYDMSDFRLFIKE